MSGMPVIHRKKRKEDMIIQLNGIRETIPDGLNIQQLIERAKEGDPDLIVEQNGIYIYPKAYDTTPVLPNAVIEFINPNLGG